MAKLLIVEDEINLLNLYADYLESEGNTVVKAVDGDQGYIQATTADWQLLFLDIMLPKLDGLALFKKLKQENRLEGKRVIVLTNIGNNDIIQEFMKLGADEYLLKSDINPSDLQNVVLKYFK